MPSYFDTSALVKLYVAEAHSARARQEATREARLPFTALQALELQAAIRQLVGRAVLPAYALPLFEQDFEEDRRAHRVTDAPLDFAATFRRADQLVRAHTGKLLCRSLDVLHVASALELGSRRFVSADDRQLALAKASGLPTVDVKA